ncbi:adenosylcobinamide-GDP ribazoletransferase [Tepiditoga spiralis]|uniref:Adenosylcobinamide-GDP ribazoletransferase n=1 Tax=Tepiditoga spiralis TaxID=2108365 RepID=A0A7G1GC97_9BACT|nr:adenosylcobinamide-GDP ribazoletransferase [Tepiditoga spiralis]BBE31979.1 adenosylcobinamide-GDP ribazoletransferase [Tepiditoga spiralis]
MFKDIFVAFGSISKIPVPIVKNINLKRSTIYFPLVGVLASLINYLTFFLLKNILTLEQLSASIMIIYYYLFQYFHFDGFVDIIDGFGAQIRSKEERIKIMKDSRTGAFALLFGILYLIIYYSFLKEFILGCFFAPIFSRLSMVYLISISKPAKKEGLGSLYFPFKKKYTFYSTLITFLIIPFGYKFVILGILIAFFSAYIMKVNSYKKINGITGDVIGATCLISEILYLILLKFI